MVIIIILKNFLWGLVVSQKRILYSLRMHFLNKLQIFEVLK